MLLRLQTLFDSELLSIRHAIASPSIRSGNDVYHETADLLLMPVAGLFAKHDGPKQHVIANANHALFLGCGKPYRISFPNDLGDESLIVEFSAEAMARLLAEAVGVGKLYSPCLNTHCLLPPAGIIVASLTQRCRQPIDD